MENLSAADVAAVTDRNGYGCGDGFGFGGSGIWLFAILALMWGGNGFFGRGQNERCATVEDLANQSNFTRLESQVQANGQAISQVGTNLYNGICNLGYEMASKFGNLEKEMSECCCRTERMLLENRYLAAQNAAEINANTTAQVQKVLDTLCADRASAQAARINQLELQQALCGVVRYPTTATYGVGFPFYGNGWGGYSGNCGCGGNY